MSIPRIHALCLTALLAGALSCHASDAPSLDDLLVQADAVRSNDPASFVQLLQEIEAREGEASRLQKERLAYLQAYSMAIRGDYDDAIVASNRLLARTDDQGLQARAGALLINMYALTRRFADGLRQLERTLTLLDDLEDAEHREHILGVAAVIHNQAGQYDLGGRYAQRVLDSTTSERARCFAGQTRLQALQNLGQVPAHNRRFDDLITLCAAQGERVVANLSRVMLARKLAADGDRRQAIQLLRQHMGDVRQSRYVPLVSEFESLLAELEFEEGNLEAAGQHAQASIDANNGTEFTVSLVNAYRTRYRIAEAEGDVAAALENFRAYTEAEKSYLNEVQAREMAYQIVRHESLQQSHEIELLNQKNTVLELQQRVAEQRAQNNGLAALLLTLLLAFIGFWAYRTKRIQMRLRRMTQVDMLTGVCNRHYFTESAEKALAQCARNGESAALVMFDLDHFKQINDGYGHAAGDWALRQVAAAAGALCRPVDCFGRLGGEEFALLLPGCDARAGERIAQDAVVRFAAIDSSVNGHRFKITASFGVTDTSLSGYDFTRLLSHADKALYRAKRAGRDRVCVHEVEPVAQLPLGQRGPEPAGNGRRSAAMS